MGIEETNEPETVTQLRHDLQVAQAQRTAALVIAAVAVLIAALALNF
jgi:hypothetical protein